jgi:hypothetical protein
MKTIFIKREIRSADDLPTPHPGSEVSEEMFIEDVKGNGYYGNYYFRYNHWVDYNTQEMPPYEVKFYLAPTEVSDEVFNLINK